MQIIRQLYQIFLRKRAPHDLDYSIEAAVILTMSMGFLRFISFSSIEQLSSPLAYSVVSVIAELAIIYALLRHQGKQNRFVQTMTALFGIAVMIAVISVLVMQTVVLQMVLPAIAIWGFYLAIIILRSALDCSTFVSFLLTMVYSIGAFVFVMVLFSNFLPEISAYVEAVQAAYEAASLEAQSK